MQAIEIIGESEDKSNEELKTICQLNSAACHLAIEQNKEAIEQCNKVLEKDPNNLKAIYRKVQGLESLKDYEQALDVLNFGLQVHPNNASLLKSKKKIENLLKSQIAQQKNFYSGLLMR